MNTGNTQYDGFDVLSHVIAFDSDGRAVWPAEDLQAMLHLLMRAPLESTLSPDPYRRNAIVSVMECARPVPRTFKELFGHRQPPIELLQMTKDFAKRSRNSSSSPLAPEVCLLLYYCAIAAALVHAGQRITKLPTDELRNGLNWLARQPWIDAQTRELAMAGLAYIRQGRHLWRA